VVYEGRKSHVSDSQRHRLKDSTQEESRAAGLNSLCIELPNIPDDVLDDKANSLGSKKPDIQTQFMNDSSGPLSLDVEDNYETPLSFSSIFKRDPRVCLLNKILCTFVDSIVFAIRSRSRKPKITSFNDALTDTGWCQLLSIGHYNDCSIYCVDRPDRTWKDTGWGFYSPQTFVTRSGISADVPV
jgi:hypothetical protein